MDNSVSPLLVTVVTVTYGKRAHLLTQVLDAARAQGVVEAVVIDNGSAAPITEILAARYGDWAFVHSMGGNTGSAEGYNTGIEQAIGRGAELILLLDDDNKLGSGALKHLVDEYLACSTTMNKDAFAVCGSRVGFGYIDKFTDKKIKGLKFKSSFNGFSIFDVPNKLAQRLKPKSLKSRVDVASLEYAIYGGLMFHAQLTKRIGLPNTNFFLYQDDVEYTSRITKSGGSIFLIRSAIIEDLDINWMTKKYSNSFQSFIRAEPSFRIYYQFRNLTYRSIHGRDCNRIILFINIFCYFLLLFSFAIINMRFSRLILLVRAFEDGRTRRMGKANWSFNNER